MAKLEPILIKKTLNKMSRNKSTSRKNSRIRKSLQQEVERDQKRLMEEKLEITFDYDSTDLVVTNSKPTGEVYCHSLTAKEIQKMERHLLKTSQTY